MVGRSRPYPGPRSLCASFSTCAAAASDGCQSCPRTASGERRPSSTLGLSNQARMPMVLYPPPRFDASRSTHSTRRATSCVTGRRPLAYKRTEVADRPNSFARSVSPNSPRSALIASCSMPTCYGVLNVPDAPQIGAAPNSLLLALLAKMPNRQLLRAPRAQSVKAGEMNEVGEGLDRFLHVQAPVYRQARSEPFDRLRPPWVEHSLG